MDPRQEARNDAMEIDLVKLFKVYWRNILIIILCGVITAGLAIAYTKLFVTPTYRADISLYVNNTKNNENSESVSTGNLSASQQLVKTYMNIISSRSFLTSVSNEIGGELDPKALGNRISSAQVGSTEMFRVYVTDTDPARAKQIADTIAKIAPGEIEKIVQGSSARIVDTAVLPTSRYSPSYTRNALIGGVLGVIIPVIVLTISFIFDVRIKDEDDYTAVTNLPILGRVPDFDDLEAGHGQKAYYGYEEVDEGVRIKKRTLVSAGEGVKAALNGRASRASAAKHGKERK